MFTGIIEEIGFIESWPAEDQMRIACQIVLTDAKIGDSIAVNGVCLTICKFDQKAFHVQVSQETIKRVSMGSFAVGSEVNLERALLATSRLGGHLVQGHVDGIGKVIGSTKLSEYKILKVALGDDLASYMVEKGSITVNGVSLTVNAVEDNTVELMIIPHTLSVTNLKRVQVDDDVNIEADILGKYVCKHLDAWKKCK